MRGLTRTILVLLAMLISAVAHAEPSDKYWDNLQKSFFPGKTIEAGPFIHITAPHRAESGAQVPFAFDIDYPMTPEKYVKNVSIIVDGNPVPLTPDEMQGVAATSCGVLRDMGPQIQWVESYVTDDKVYCVYIAPSEDMVREHAKQGGFPANKVSEIKRMIDPTTAEER